MKRLIRFEEKAEREYKEQQPLPLLVFVFVNFIQSTCFCYSESYAQQVTDFMQSMLVFLLPLMFSSIV